MDELTKKRLLKTGELSIVGLDSAEEVHAIVMQAADLLGIRGRGTKSRVRGVGGAMVRRSFVPFAWGDPEFEADDATIRCFGYELAGFEYFRAENDYLLYLDHEDDTVGQYRRVEVRDGSVVDVCRSGLLGEGNVIGHIDDAIVVAHPLSKVLGKRLRWYVRCGEDTLFGFDEFVFVAITGQIAEGAAALLQRWIQVFDEGIQSDVPVLLGCDDTSAGRR